MAYESRNVQCLVSSITNACIQGFQQPFACLICVNNTGPLCYLLENFGHAQPQVLGKHQLCPLLLLWPLHSPGLCICARVIIPRPGWQAALSLRGWAEPALQCTIIPCTLSMQCCSAFNAQMTFNAMHCIEKIPFIGGLPWGNWCCVCVAILVKLQCFLYAPLFSVFEWLIKTSAHLGWRTMYSCSTKTWEVYWEIHPRRPRDFPRAKPKGNLEAAGDVCPNTSRVLVVYGYSLINLSAGSGSGNPNMWAGKDWRYQNQSFPADERMGDVPPKLTNSVDHFILPVFYGRRIQDRWGTDLTRARFWVRVMHCIDWHCFSPLSAFCLKSFLLFMLFWTFLFLLQHCGKGRLDSGKLINFQKNYKLPLTMLRFFLKNHKIATIFFRHASV